MEQKSIISEQTRKELDKNTVDFYLSEAENNWMAWWMCLIE